MTMNDDLEHATEYERLLFAMRKMVRGTMGGEARTVTLPSYSTSGVHSNKPVAT